MVDSGGGQLPGSPETGSDPGYGSDEEAESQVTIDEPACFIIRLLFGFASDSVFANSIKISTNSEMPLLAMLSIRTMLPKYTAHSTLFFKVRKLSEKQAFLQDDILFSTLIHRSKILLYCKSQ